MIEVPLSDEAWERVKNLLPKDPTRRFGRSPRDPRKILNATLWVVIRQDKWQRLPSNFPLAQTCYIR
jgi:transposase